MNEVRKLKRRSHFGDLNINGRIMFRRILPLEDFNLNSQALCPLVAVMHYIDQNTSSLHYCDCTPEPGMETV
jgi:hypothetical protein